MLAAAKAAPEDPKVAEKRRMREDAARKKAEMEEMRKKIQAQLLAHKKPKIEAADVKSEDVKPKLEAEGAAEAQ